MRKETNPDGVRQLTLRDKKRADRAVPEPLALSIDDTAATTGESSWTVKQRLRRGDYKAKKAGRRTLVVYQSIKDFWERLPEATFMPPKRAPSGRDEAA